MCTLTLQMDLSRARAPLEQQLFRAHRARRPRRGQLRQDRQRDRRARQRRSAQGLTEAAARDFGLNAGTPVGAVADRRACRRRRHDRRPRSRRGGRCVRRLAYIMGTSACIMASTAGTAFRPRGLGAVFFRHGARALAERRRPIGGWRRDRSSRAGRTLLITRPPRRRSRQAWTLLEYLEERRILRTHRNPGEAALAARDIHVCRSSSATARRTPIPRRARSSRASISMRISRAMERLFVAGLCGLAYGLADVVDALRTHGIGCDTDGHQRRSQPQSAGAPDHGGYHGPERRVAATPEPVCSARRCWARSPAAACGSIGEAMAAMSAIGCLSEPTSPGMSNFHAAKRRVHGLMRKLDRESRDAMRDIKPASTTDSMRP